MDEIHLKNYGTSNEPYYLASDIGIILGIKRIRSTLHLVQDENKFKMYHNISGGKQLCYFINTNGLKTIIISSRKPM